MRALRDIAWVAGIIEGEGTIIASTGAYRKNTKHVVRQFRLAIEMTDLDVLQRAKEVLGPRCTLRQRKPPSVNPNHRDRFILCLTGSELAGWLMTIYPFMGQRRRARIRLALNLWKQMRPSWRYAELPETSLRVVA